MSSRAAPVPPRAGCPPICGGWTVGALVQANYGMRNMLRCGHAPVGLEITDDVVPVPEREIKPKADQGSIIVILATDAPLLPIQCQRLARRATTGLAWVGGFGSNSSGDIFLAFSTGNAVPLKIADDQHAHAGHGSMHAACSRPRPKRPRKRSGTR